MKKSIYAVSYTHLDVYKRQVTRYGREGEIINHTGDGPVLLYIEKINNEWVVVDKDEPA